MHSSEACHETATRHRQDCGGDVEHDNEGSVTMRRSRQFALLGSTLLAGTAIVAACATSTSGSKVAGIQNVVVIYAENRSFDNLYSGFPGANGLQNVSADQARQTDRNGKPFTE